MNTIQNIRKLSKILALASCTLFAVPAYSSDITYADDSYTSGDTLTAADLNAKFNEIKADVNDNDTNIGTNTTAIGTKQNIVTDTCTAGSSIRQINADGTVVCEVDDNTDSGGDITGVTAGTGLSGGGNTGDVSLNVDPSQVQTRISGTCAAGNSIRVINSNGTVTCEPDTDTDTTYSAGIGLELNGTTFDISDNAIGAAQLAATTVSIPGSAFLATNPAVCHPIYAGNSGLTFQVSGACNAIAPIMLPHGVNIDSFDCDYRDWDADMRVTYIQLRTRTRSTGGNSVRGLLGDDVSPFNNNPVSTYGFAGTGAETTAPAIVNFAVDNNTYHYYFFLRIESQNFMLLDGKLNFGGCRIYYS